MSVATSADASPYERKALSAFALAITLGILLAIAALVWLASSIYEQRSALAQLQAAVARAQAARDGSSRGVSAGGGAEQRLFKAATPSEFQSQLQSHVKDVAAKHNVTVDALQTMNAERAGGLNKLTLRLDAVIPNAAIGPFLAELATGEPLVLLQSMELRQVMLQANRLNNGGRPDSGTSARLDLTAYAAPASQRLVEPQRPTP